MTLGYVETIQNSYIWETNAKDNEKRKAEMKEESNRRRK